MKNTIIIIAFLILIIATSFVLWHIDHQPHNGDVIAQELPNGRAAWRSMMRSNIMQPEKVIKARQAMKAQVAKSSNQKDGGLREWTELNPNNEGGRVRAIATHPTNPDILFAGGASGGIWKSTNQGASWAPLNDFLPSPSITAIIIHPTHPDTMYVSTGEGITGNIPSASSTPGAGIFRSFDGGIKWELLPSIDPNNLTDFYWVGALAFDPSDPSRFYAGSNGLSIGSPAGGVGNLYIFENHGETKNESSAFTSNSVGGIISNITVNTNDPNHIMVGSSFGLNISTDKGISWTGLSTFNTSGWVKSPGRVEVAMSESDANVVYALTEKEETQNKGVLLRSSDKGSTWTRQRSLLQIFDPSGTGANNGWYHNVIWVSPTNTAEILFGGVDLWRSINSGISIQKVSDWTQNSLGTSLHADQHRIVTSSDYSNSNKKLYFGNDGGVASTDDWTTVDLTTGWDLLNNNSLGITQFYNSDIFGNDPNYLVAGAQDNGTLFSDDSGATWTNPNGGDGGWCAISKQDQNLVYLSIQFGLFKVKYTCAPFVGTFLDYFDLKDFEGDPPFFAHMEIFPNDGQQILIGGDRLWHVQQSSITCAGTVTEISPRDSIPGAYISAIDIKNDGNKVYVGYTNGQIYKSTSASPWTWDLVYSDPGGRTITDISINPNISNKVAISIGGYITDQVLLTNDAGGSWIVRSNNLPEIHVNTLIWHPENNSWLYAGTDLGILATEDNGQNWNVSPNFFNTSDGPGFVEVTHLQFTRAATLGGHRLVATTFGRGIWKTNTQVYTDVYVDEDDPNIIKNGRMGTPFIDIHEAESVQAHGQTWHVDGGSYPTSSTVILDKRLDEIKHTGTGTIIIGNN